MNFLFTYLHLFFPLHLRGMKKFHLFIRIKIYILQILCETQYLCLYA